MKNEKFTLSKNLFEKMFGDKIISLNAGDVNIIVDKKNMYQAMAVTRIETLSGSVREDMPEYVFVDGLYMNKAQK